MKTSLLEHYSLSQLPLWRKIGYALGGFGDSLAFNTISFYLIFYLTTIAGIPPAEVGVMVNGRP
jgi:GPH family glycoside/pentoside/hexuronide:cation symporter